MDNLIAETNSRLREIIENLTTIKNEYEEKLKENNKDIDAQLEKVQKYKADFFESKSKIEKMNADIEGFETDYQKLVERFKDDELANILIAANKEISLKIDERKRKIIKDKTAMNELVDKAESVKSKLVKLTAEKKALELCLNKILDAYEYYSTSLGEIINYSNANKDNLCSKYNTSSLESINGIEHEENKPHDEDLFITEDDDSSEDDENPSSITNEQEEVVENNILDDVEDEEVENLEPVDISDMVKDEDIEISDYDNDNIVEGDEHKIVIEDKEPETLIKDDKKDEDKEIDLNLDIDFDDSLEDDDSLYE